MVPTDAATPANEPAAAAATATTTAVAAASTGTSVNKTREDSQRNLPAGQSSAAVAPSTKEPTPLLPIDKNDPLTDTQSAKLTTGDDDFVR